MSPRPRRTVAEARSRTILLVAIVVHLVFLSSLATHVLNPLFDDATHRVGQGADFFAIYQASQNLTDGVSVYSPVPLTSVVPYSYPYRYLPFTAYTLGPFFRLFPPLTAYWMWILILELLLLVDLAVTRRIFASADRARLAMSLWLLFSPLYLELYMGQFSFFMASLYFWAIVLWMRRETTLAGDALWTVSLLVKTNSALFAPVLLKQRRGHAVLAAAGIVAALSVPYFVIMHGTFHAFAWNVTDGLSVETLAGNQGFPALIAEGMLRLTHQWSPTVEAFAANIPRMNDLVRLPLLVWALLVYGVSAWLTMRTRRAVATDLFVLWLLTYFLTYKHVWEHQYVMALPAFVLLFRGAGDARSPVRVPPALVGLAFAVVALPTPFVLIDQAHAVIDPEFSWSTLESFLFHAGKPVAILVLYASLATAIWSGGREPLAGRSEARRATRRAPAAAAGPA